MSVPHVLPYVLFVAIGAAGGLLPEALRLWADPLRAAAAGAALLVFLRRGAYPELERSAPRVRRAWALSVAIGLAVGLVWTKLGGLVPSLGSRGGFDTNAAGEGHATALLSARLIGSCLVVPCAEELLVRSFLPRFVDAPDDWSSRAVGAFTKVSAAVSIGFFTLTHPEWLAALVTGVLLTLLLAATRRLRDAVVAHAIANAVVAAEVLATGDTRWW